MAKAREDGLNKGAEHEFKLAPDLSDLEDELSEQCSNNGESQFKFFKDFTSSVSIARTDTNFVD
jgi:hypothetical protein